MASKDENVIEFPGKGNSKQGKDTKKPKTPKSRKSITRTIGWIAGVVILVLISVTFILPTTIFSSSSGSSYTFGKYNGEKITLEYGNYFYLTVNNIYNMYAQIFGGSVPEGLEYSIYYQAFQQSAIYTALNQLASKAKIKPSAQSITEAEIASGYWLDEDGHFDSARYNETSSFQKQQISNIIALQYPVTLVTNDITGAKVSQAESAFIENLSKNGKSYDYLVIDTTLISDEDAINYAKGNQMPFTSRELSMVSYSTYEEALDMLENLESGAIPFIDATVNSTDSYAPLDGIIGDMTYTNLASLLFSDTQAADEVFSSSTGSYSGPYSTTYGYSIIKTDSEPALPDFENDSTIATRAKQYMATTDRDSAIALLTPIADEVYNVAKSDFEGAEDKYELMVGTVNGLVDNPSSSSYIKSNTSADSLSYLASAVNSDQNYMATLNSLKEGEVSEPKAINNVIIIAKAVAPSSGESNTYGDNYALGAGNDSLEDYQNSVLSSDKFVDNFADEFMKAFGSNF